MRNNGKRKKAIKNFFREVENRIDKFLIYRKKKGEIKKYQDKRRVDIYSKVELTREQKKSIDTLYESAYGVKIPYTWHRHFTAYTGRFDVNYFPELLFIPEFEHYMNSNRHFANVVSDKNMLSLLAKAVGIRMPITYLAVSDGVFRDINNELVSKEKVIEVLGNVGEAFIKPTVESGSGKGCSVINIQDGKDIISGKKLHSIIEEMGDNFVIQERVKCHESIRNIYPDSVNTFRIMTYRWKGDFWHVPSIMRIGKDGNWLDNAHAGGMFIAVEDDGTLHEEAYTEFLLRYREHPNTHMMFRDYKIDLFPEVLRAAQKMHINIPQLGLINWDFTIDSEGLPVLIEANVIGGSIWLFQMAHGCGAFGEHTEEILQWMKKMKRVKKKDRDGYKFGR